MSIANRIAAVVIVLLVALGVWVAADVSTEVHSDPQPAADCSVGYPSWPC